MPTSNFRLGRRDLWLLVALTLAWGLNWPVMKAGVQQMAPLYFRVLCLGGGLVALWAYARFAGISLAVPAGAWPRIVQLALPNMIIWHVLLILALKLLPAGRSAILGYTMPVWTVVFGLAVFHERVPRIHLIGVAAAFAGTVLLLSSEIVALSGRPLGVVLILVAAACWGYGTHLLRRHLTEMPALALTFWMLVLAFAVLLAASAIFEHAAWRLPSPLEWGSILYNMLIAVAFCHVAWSVLARRLPPAASGLSVMLIPVLGVFSSMWLLGETPHWQDYAALALILVSLSTVLFGRPPAAPAR